MSEKIAREQVYGRSGRRCERCSIRRATNWHHRRAAGRIWTAENGLDLCGTGTTGCHGWVTEHPAIAREYGWIVRSTTDPLWVPVLVWGSWCYLTRDGQKVSIPSEGLPDVALAFPDRREPARPGGTPRGLS